VPTVLSTRFEAQYVVSGVNGSRSRESSRGSCCTVVSSARCASA